MPSNSTSMSDRGALLMFPFCGVKSTPVVGPRLEPKIETISPGDTGPGTKDAPFTTLLICGAGTFATARFTVVVRSAVPGAVMVKVPVQLVPGWIPVRLGVTVTVAVEVAPDDVVPATGATLKKLPPQVVCVVPMEKLMGPPALVRVSEAGGTVPPGCPLKLSVPLVRPVPDSVIDCAGPMVN